MRDPFRSPRLSTQRELPQRYVNKLFACMLVVCFAALCQPIHTQATTPQDKQEHTMKHYVLIFHSTRTLSPEEIKHRGVDIAAWVKQVTDMGVTLDPRSLEETLANFSADGDQIVSREGSSDPTFRNLVFFDSASSEQAVTIARTHPGLRYGATVEVREWTSPRGLASSR